MATTANGVITAKRPVIFLDVDGVIVLFGRRNAFHEPSVDSLMDVAARAGATVVLTSNWKRYPEDLAKVEGALAACNERRRRAGLGLVAPAAAAEGGGEGPRGGLIHSCTPEGAFDGDVAVARCRGILEWLNTGPGVDSSWVAVDDMALSEVADSVGLNPSHFVRTNRERGITPKDAESMYTKLTS
ncbi:hypothetical protein Pelo_10275 [Pelomyxa schiedti]|nr:hypothetical protein Pelo_10272 [Pelomyxa schiedti]KAH3757981.1 hypothetical protein Pelo_10275 [Pelomyxa schiedti]